MNRIEKYKNNIIDDDLKQIALQEKLHLDQLIKQIVDGTIVIVKNSQRSIKPLVIGKNTRIKINANIGTSSSKVDLDEEMEKMNIAVKYGADAIMDLSTAGDLRYIRQKLIDSCPVAFGTVPLYEMVLLAKERKKSVVEITPDEMFDVIEDHCKQGVDFLTLHCGVTQQTVRRFLEVERLAGAVSRGGTILMEWIHYNKKENPLYAEYDRLVEILSRYDVAISLGDGFRPGAIKDASDRVQIEELSILGELVRRARAKNVGVFVEGPGHVPLQEIATNIQIQKSLCEGAPFYVLGPLVTDVSLGYDHISGAIGGAIAGMAGADFLCYVTPAEHLRLPSVQDVREGTIASLIAAHAADIARGYPGAMEWDQKISEAKINLDWEKVLSLCVDQEKARTYRASLPPMHQDEQLCSMCGEFCAVKRSKNIH